MQTSSTLSMSFSESAATQRIRYGPSSANGTEPAISQPASRRLGEPSRQCTAAPPDL